jgi:hypothetical protein
VGSSVGINTNYFCHVVPKIVPRGKGGWLALVGLYMYVDSTHEKVNLSRETCWSVYGLYFTWPWVKTSFNLLLILSSTPLLRLALNISGEIL